MSCARETNLTVFVCCYLPRSRNLVQAITPILFEIRNLIIFGRDEEEDR